MSCFGGFFFFSVGVRSRCYSLPGFFWVCIEWRAIRLDIVMSLV